LGRLGHGLKGVTGRRILDDVHTLHPDQFEALFRALARREIRFARWMMMRMCLANGLTLNRGGFLERRVSDLSLVAEKV
jgi:hypothetical protein